MARSAENLIRQSITFDIRRRECNFNRGILTRGERFRIGDRSIIHRRDRQGYRFGLAVCRTIIDLESKGIGTIVIGVWCVGYFASGTVVSAQCAIDRLVDNRKRQRIAVNIRRRECNFNRGILIRGERFRIGDRSIIHGIDSNCHSFCITVINPCFGFDELIGKRI